MFFPPDIQVMMDAVSRARRGLIRDFYEVENLQVSLKGTKEFVTVADTKSETKILEVLQEARPKFNFLSEEAGEIKGQDSNYRFIIDPLDGTFNFMHGFHYFAISIALEKTTDDGHSEIVAAVVDAPILKETFWAQKGHGAYVETADLQRIKMRVSSRNRLERSLFGFGSLYYGGDKQSKFIDLMRKNHIHLRCTGASALDLAYLAAGKFDCYFQSKISPWDIAAGILLIKEAGGAVSDIVGGDDMLARKEIIAANSGLFPALLKHAQSVYL
jgi:myo-inositol-1(or 4)-monophosphatase